MVYIPLILLNSSYSQTKAIDLFPRGKRAYEQAHHKVESIRIPGMQQGENVTFSFVRTEDPSEDNHRYGLELPWVTYDWHFSSQSQLDLVKRLFDSRMEALLVRRTEDISVGNWGGVSLTGTPVREARKR